MRFAKITHVRAIVVLLLVGVVTLFCIIGAALWLASRTAAYSEALVEVPQIRRTVYGALGLVQQAESGQRGFLLTREDIYLEPYLAAKAELSSLIADLRERVRGKAEYDVAVDRLAELIGTRVAELDETVGLAQSGRADEALAIVRSGRGRQSMAAVREAADELLGRINGRLDGQAARMRASVAALTWVLEIGGVLLLAMGAAATWFGWRHNVALAKAEFDVRELNALLEERVRERTVDLARANAEIQRFAYIVSHDLRSPLVNVMGFTSELETGLAAVRAHFDKAVTSSDDPVERDARLAVEGEMPEAIGFIRTSTAKMDSLINAILRLSREGRRVLTPERIDMAALLESAADSVRHRLNEQNGTIETVAPIPDIVSDRLALEQVFGNLLDNAVKYLDPSRSGRIVLRGSESRTGLLYEVEDNGRGIAAEDHDRIFDLFRRAGPQDTPGEGIGLSHVRALIRRLGGDIDLQSELGRGTTFRVRLPKRPLLHQESA